MTRKLSSKSTLSISLLGILLLAGCGGGSGGSELGRAFSLNEDPSSLQASVEGTDVQLTWVDNSADETSFKIERTMEGASEAAPVSVVLEAGKDATSLRDGGLQPFTQYTYTLRAMSGSFSSTPISATVTTMAAALTPPNGIPAAPTDFVAVWDGTTLQNAHVDVSWTNNASNVDAFVLNRKKVGSCEIPSDWDFEGWNKPWVTSFVDTPTITTIKDVFFYRMVVRTFEGLESTPVYFCLRPPVPADPTDLKVLTDTNTVPYLSERSVPLVWTDNSNNEDSFKVYRRPALTAGAFDLIATLPPNSTSYTDETVFPHMRYTYVVMAKNRLGTGESNQITVTAEGEAVPFAPSDIQVAGTTSTSITLSFQDNSFNEIGFQAEGMVGPGGEVWNFVDMGDPVFAASPFVNTRLDVTIPNLEPHTTYRLTVHAYNVWGIGSTTQTVLAQTN